MFELQTLILIVAFIGCSALVYAGFIFLDPYQSQVRARLKDLSATDEPRAASVVVARAGEAEGAVASNGLLRLLAPFRSDDKARLTHRFTKAGIYSPAAVSRLVAARLVLAALPPVVAIAAGFSGYLQMENALLFGCAAGAAGSILPGLWLERRMSRRQLQFRKSLPDFLDLMIVCLEGGLSLQETIRRVGEELRFVHPTLSLELGIVQRDMGLGSSVDQALRRFASRTDDEAIRSLSTFIRESQRFGTNITEALRNHSEMLRTQREQAAEENAQKASVKILLPTLLLIFPAIFVVLVGPAIIQIQQAFGGQ